MSVGEVLFQVGCVRLRLHRLKHILKEVLCGLNWLALTFSYVGLSEIMPYGVPCI